MTKSKKTLNIFTAIVILLLIVCTIASFAIRIVMQPKVETVQATEYNFKISQDWFKALTIPNESILYVPPFTG